MANSIVKQEVWIPAVIENMRIANIATAFVDDSPVVTNAGTAKIVSYGAVSTGTYVPLTDFTLGDASFTASTLTLDQSKYWALGIDDTELAQTTPELALSLTREGAAAMAETVDKYLLGLHTLAITANKITGASNAAIDLATVDIYEKLVDAGTKLTKQSAPLNGRWLVITPEVYARVLKDTEHFIRASALGDMVVTTARFPGSTPFSTPGFVGQIAGFDTYVSNNVAKASSDANAYLVYGQGKPVHFASQLGDVELARPSQQFSTIIKQLLVFGAAVLGPNTKRIGSIYVVNS